MYYIEEGKSGKCNWSNATHADCFSRNMEIHLNAFAHIRHKQTHKKTSFPTLSMQNSFWHTQSSGTRRKTPTEENVNWRHTATKQALKASDACSCSQSICKRKKVEIVCIQIHQKVHALVLIHFQCSTELIERKNSI